MGAVGAAVFVWAMAQAGNKNKMIIFRIVLMIQKFVGQSYEKTIVEQEKRNKVSLFCHVECQKRLERLGKLTKSVEKLMSKPCGSASFY